MANPNRRGEWGPRPGGSNGPNTWQNRNGASGPGSGPNEANGSDNNANGFPQDAAPSQSDGATLQHAHSTSRGRPFIRGIRGGGHPRGAPVVHSQGGHGFGAPHRGEFVPRGRGGFVDRGGRGFNGRGSRPYRGRGRGGPTPADNSVGTN